MKKSITLTLAAAVMVLGLAGCGENQIPELTDEQTQLLGEFTAFTLMRYDANNRSRLVDYTLLITPPDPEQTPEPVPTQKPGGMDPVDDTPVIGANGQAGSLGYGNIEETLELPDGISVSFLDYALYNRYPEGDTIFGMTATEGKKLLVLNASISNASGQNQAVDLLHAATEFRITVNGDFIGRAFLTGLESDLSTFEGTVLAGESVETMLVIEVDESVAENITSILVNVKNGQNACAIQVF
ncbi:MAG: hypothetical protein J1E03_10465 [Acetatifactor sp.]|nr:hypothetical protein [Acetatifactor sp.]